MQFTDYHRMRKGWFTEWLEDQRAQRKHTYAVVVAILGKDVPSEFSLLPLPKDEEVIKMQKEAQDRANKLSLDRNLYRKKRDHQAKLRDMFEQRKQKRERS